MKSIVFLTTIISVWALRAHAQEWGYKKDTLYYNNFGSETKQFNNDTLVSEYQVYVKKEVIDGELKITNNQTEKYLGILFDQHQIKDLNKIDLYVNLKLSKGLKLVYGNLEVRIYSNSIKIYKSNKHINSFASIDTNDLTMFTFTKNKETGYGIWVDQRMGGLVKGENPQKLSYELPSRKGFVIKKCETENKNGIREIKTWKAQATEEEFVGVTQKLEKNQYTLENQSSKNYKLPLFNDFEKGNNIELNIEINEQIGFDILTGIYKINVNEKKLSFYNVVDTTLIRTIYFNKYNQNSQIRFEYGAKTLMVFYEHQSISVPWLNSYCSFNVNVKPKQKFIANDLLFYKNVNQSFNEFLSKEIDRRSQEWNKQQQQILNKLVKGEFEKTSEFEQRKKNAIVTKSYNDFREEIINEEGLKRFRCNFLLTTYDPDKEIYTIKAPELDTVYLSIPPRQAKALSGKFCEYKLSNPRFTYINNRFLLESATIAVTNIPYPLSNLKNTNLPLATRQIESKSVYSKTKVASALQTREYYLLVIANQDYRDGEIADLSNPISESEALISTLTSFYNFKKQNVKFLKNATRSEIIKSFDDIARVVKPEDNLLIYYAGHGLWDKDLSRGYWLPTDATKDNRANWFSNSNLRDYIAGINTKHTLLISDACFSGSIFKTREAFSTGLGINELYKLNSRQAITSGTLETVPDKSVFSKYLLKRLRENTNEMMTAQDLFSSFRIAVINNSPSAQVPQFGDIREAGDEGGEFIFIRK